MRRMPPLASARFALIASLLVGPGCFGPRVASYEVTQLPPQPVKAVSLEIDPTPPYIVGQERIHEIVRALRPGLSRYGIQVVEHGQQGAPALIGVVESYEPGTDSTPFKRAGRGVFRARWRLVDAFGVTLGECRTEATNRRALVLQTDWGSAMEDTGYRLGQFLSKR
jgi:hypothetical protein